MSYLLLQGDARRIPLADGVVQTCVTSPPYWGLRDYGVAGQLGLEATPDEFVAKMVAVFREVWRVLREDGTCWVNMGDSYASNGASSGWTPQTTECKSGQWNSRRAGGCDSLKPKDLVGIPWRLAFALQADGWYLRSDIIWCLSGGTRLWVKSQKGVMPMTIHDMVRLEPSTVQLWNGTKWTQVLGWSQSPERGDPLEIVLRSGERIQCTPNHVWPTQRGNVQTDQLVAGDVIQATTLPGPDRPSSPNMLPDEIVGWFVGLYIAEGSRDSGGTIQIAGHTKEVDRLKRLEELAAFYHGSCRIHVHGENNCTINLDGPMLRAIIESYVAGNTSKGKHLTVKAWQRSGVFLMAVLQGYLSGDGHWDEPNNRWRLGFTLNDSWAGDLRTICARVGVSLRLNKTMHSMNGRKFPGYRGEIRFSRSDHHNNRSDTEVIEINASKGRSFWDIGVADEPHLFALASGVLTHNSKPNPMPESVTDRPTKSHEYLFLLSKSERYFFDADAVREESQPGNAQRTTDHYDSCHRGPKDGGNSGLDKLAERMRDGSHSGRNIRTVWSIPTESYPGSHFATYPRKLVEPCVKAGTSEKGCCPECGAGWVREVESERVQTRPGATTKTNGHTSEVFGNRDPGRHVRIASTTGWHPGCSHDAAPVPCVVLDPFSGSGTTGVVANALGRDFVGVELNPEYIKMAQQRIDRPHAPVKRASKVAEHYPLLAGLS